MDLIQGPILHIQMEKPESLEKATSNILWTTGRRRNLEQGIIEHCNVEGGSSTRLYLEKIT